MKKYAYITGAGFLALFLSLFGTGILNNIHNQYLRVLSTWTVKLTNQAGNSGATGFIVKGASGKKYILTNAHVCGLADEGGMVYAHYRGETFQAKVFKKYQYNDLCALEAHRPLGPSVNIASSVTLGESTWVIGHPLLEPRTVSVGELSGTVFVPIMVGINPKPGECDGPTYQRIPMDGFLADLLGATELCVRTLEANAGTMMIQPGNSGSAVVNVWGSVVAVCFAGNEAGTRSYFVPLQDLKQFIQEL